MRRVMVVGNLGYVGPVVVAHLRQTYGQDIEILGYDCGLFADCLTMPGPAPETLLDRQISGDVRGLAADVFAGCEAVVYLAAISNDPMGARFAAVTDAVNHVAALRAAELAKRAGVKSFVFASSCSVYGAAADGAPRGEGDHVLPLSAYARSKIDAEAGLAALDAGGMRIRCLRFATACGNAPRLRLDLVLNDFVASAVSTGEITVLSDGSPWRPLIHVDDMARAIDWACFHADHAPGFLIVNVGADGSNWRIGDLAEAVRRAIPGTALRINTEAPPDRRSYRVDFGLFARLAPAHAPRVTLDDAIAGLRDGLRMSGFSGANFRRSRLVRLVVLEELIAAGKVGADLRTIGQG